MKELYSTILLVSNKIRQNEGGGFSPIRRTIVPLLLLALTAGGFLPATAQQRTKPLNGVVLDEGGQPMIGVTIVDPKNPASGTTSGNQGAYRIIVGRTCDSLRFSFIGYKAQTVAIREAALVRMEPEAQSMDAVVVTGIYTRKAESYTGASKTLTSSDIMRVGNQNLLQSLKNIDPTIYMPDNMLAGSDPNALPTISMRGNSSFPGAESAAAFKSNYRNQPNQPLFILDGFETSLETVMDMDMNRVESMTLLKDASAKALYGSKAANGVIVIETRRLSSGRPTISYNGSMSVELPDLSSYDLCNAFEKLQAEVNEGMYTSDNPNQQVQRTKLYNARYKLASEGLSTDWLAKPLRTGIGHKHTLSVELGDPQGLRALLDVSYNDVQGVMKGSGRQNTQITANIAYRTKKLLFRNILTVLSNKSKESPYGSFGDYAKMNPFWQATDAEGNVYRYAEGSDGYNGISQVANPLYDATIGTTLTSSYLSFTNNFYAEWQVLKSLKIVGRFGASQQRNDSDEFYPAKHSMFVRYPEDQLLDRGKYNLESGKRSNFSGDLNLNFNQAFGKHSVFANLRMNAAETTYSAYRHTAEGFPNSAKADITMARRYALGTKPVGMSSLNRELGFLAAASYDYDNRYLVDATCNLSASSLFGADNRWATSWSVGLGWNLHNEPFMQNQKVVKRFKLRGSVGLTGNQNFTTNSSIATYLYYTGVSYQGQTGAYLSLMPNPELRWEQKKDYNVGVDLQIWRLNLTADLFRADTEHMLTDMSIPTSTGFGSVKTNLGLVRDSGFELQGNFTAWQGKNGYFSLNGSIHYSKNKIISLSKSMHSYNEQMRKSAAAAGNSTPVLLYEDGRPMNAIWAVPSAGIDPATGREIYIKKDGSLSYIYDSNDMVVAGVADPKYRGTFGFSGEWKGIGLSTTFSYLGGGQMYNTTLVDRIENVNMAYNVDRRVLLGRWTTPGQITPYKKFDSSESTRPTTRFVQDRNEVTISSISAYYEFPRSVVKPLHMQRMRLTFYINNVATFSSIKVERGLSYPFARTMSVALTATF